MLKVGVGITTMGRPRAVERCVRTLKDHTDPDLITLLVSDDGTETPTWVRRESLYLRNSRGGVARNKNRCLHRLFLQENCDIVILLDDDVFFTSEEWLGHVVKATRLFGHINKYCGSTFWGGDGSAEHPYQVREFAGSLIGISREAFNQVGFMDPQFGLFGCEHVEYTYRMVASGYGGRQVAPGCRPLIYAIKEAGFTCMNDFPTTGDTRSVEESKKLLPELSKNRGYKRPWVSDGDWEAFITECQVFRQ